MKKVAVVVMALLITACSSAPKPKQPNDSNRQPVNKTMPAELGGNQQ